MRFGMVFLFLASLLISSGCKSKKDTTLEKKSEAANVVTDMNIQKAPDGK